MTFQELATVIQLAYNLSDTITDQLEFQYSTLANGGKPKTVWIECDSNTVCGDFIDGDGQCKALTIDDVEMKVRYRLGDIVKQDCSCDSDYMLSAMDKVGSAIRAAFHWIPPSSPCYLVMDNAGRHGSKEAIGEYKRMLLEKYNIIIIFQIP